MIFPRARRSDLQQPQQGFLVLAGEVDLGHDADRAGASLVGLRDGVFGTA
eukprot:COSAG01_NODE_801_length_13466_cov_585.329693_8_plen_50_part_00